MISIPHEEQMGQADTKTNTNNMQRHDINESSLVPISDERNDKITGTTTE